ncbi:hypothetical protein [Rubripirellula lacrimiformis]|uniref:hypothetical protein n=1 Tax=Rubripirellula lacrimiformis TaxID=1930273 RepID=UPI001C54DCB1|nr:hypothetical protein [Rubripirellula lacrimiformis]
MTFEVLDAEDAVGARWSDGQNHVALVDLGGTKYLLLNQIQCSLISNVDYSLPFQITMHRNVHGGYDNYIDCFVEVHQSGVLKGSSCNRYFGTPNPVELVIRAGDSVSVTIGSVTISDSATANAACESRECEEMPCGLDEPQYIITGLRWETAGAVDAVGEEVRIHYVGDFSCNLQKVKRTFTKTVSNSQYNGTRHATLHRLTLGTYVPLSATEESEILDGLKDGSLCSGNFGNYQWRFVDHPSVQVDFTHTIVEEDLGIACGSGAPMPTPPTSGTFLGNVTSIKIGTVARLLNDKNRIGVSAEPGSTRISCPLVTCEKPETGRAVYSVGKTPDLPGYSETTDTCGFCSLTESTSTTITSSGSSTITVDTVIEYVEL